MIGKKIPNPNKTASKAIRIGRLAEYIGNPELAGSGEKCLYAGAEGFIADNAYAQRLEMVALAMDAPRSKDPVNHYVLSWQEGEQPTPVQCDQAVKILLHELGLDGHQVIYGLHVDTDNLHLHVMVNRVHPETERATEINKGFDIEVLHRAIARIEHEQGWAREVHGRYLVEENHDLVRVWDEQRPMPTTKARDMELYTGEKSAQRIGIERMPPIVKQATGWKDLHRRLAEEQMRYERKGSGAVLWVGTQPIKASTADRNASLARLEKRFGPYEAAGQEKVFQRLEAEPLRAESVQRGWGDYSKARREHYERKATSWDELRWKIDGERKQLFQEQRQERKKVLSFGGWRGKGMELNVMRSVLAAQQAAARAVQNDVHDRERAALRLNYSLFPPYEEWLRRERNAKRAQEWRYSRDRAVGIEGEAQPARTMDIRDFVYAVRGSEVHYRRKEEQGGSVSFVDTGHRIAIHDWRHQDSLFAALQLAQAKWSQGFVVTGHDEYKAACVRLVAEHGLRITNPELQKAIEVERARIQQERAASKKAPELREFARYHAAVQAERYRVTAIRMLPDGQKRATVLGKSGGEMQGFTLAEMEQRTAEFVRLAGRGENIYFTPFSEKSHHILVDDMDVSSVQKFLADGYKPAVVLESSPGNYQAIVTVPKLDTPHDREVGNRLAERLNHEYGDAKLSGGVHPHHAPGYANFRPEHRREDNTYPQVRLVASERRECGKTLDLTRAIDAEYAEQAREVPKVERVQDRERGELSLSQIYDVHRADILARHYGPMDDSRLDSMIAVRMRTTAFDRVQIESAIRAGAPRSRPQELREDHQWDDYARRTAASAFTPRADQQIEALLPKAASEWARLEGRELNEARSVTVPLTEKQFKRLAQAEHVNDAVFKATVEGSQFAFMDGAGRAGYDKETKQFFVQVNAKDRPALEKKIHNLSRLTEKARNSEIER